jgi:hypothetical protein
MSKIRRNPLSSNGCILTVSFSTSDILAHISLFLKAYHASPEKNQFSGGYSLFAEGAI